MWGKVWVPGIAPNRVWRHYPKVVAEAPTAPQARPQGLAALTRRLAPQAVRITYCPGNALPYRVEWDAATGSQPMFFGRSPDQAADEALHALTQGNAPAPGEHATSPAGTGEYAEALREWIEDTERTHPTRPALRIVPDPDPTGDSRDTTPLR